jgi:hypothetical protein
MHELDAPSPLAWFQSVWPRLQDADITSKDLLNAENLYGFVRFAERIRDEGIAAPTTYDELRVLLQEKWYSNRVDCRDGYVLVETDDDEVQLAFWWVSGEVFLQEEELFACYAADPLPSEIGGGGFDPGSGIAVTGNADAAGAVFGAFATVWDGSNLFDLLGPVQVRGARLGSFVAWLHAMPPGKIALAGVKKAWWGNVDHLLELDWLALVARHNPKLDLPELLGRLAEVPPFKVSEHEKEITQGTLTECELRKDVSNRLGSREPAVVLQRGEKT